MHTCTCGQVFRGEPCDAKVVARLYRQLIEDGFNGLTKLCYRGQGWEDETLYELAATLKQAPCENLTELLLTYSLTHLLTYLKQAPCENLTLSSYSLTHLLTYSLT